MTHDKLTYDDLLHIVELIKSSERFSEFRLKIGDIEIELRRRDGSGDGAFPPPAVARDASIAGGPGNPAQRPAGPIAAARTAAPAATHGVRPGAVVVRAPVIGTFYRSPAPGAPPFVTVGRVVEPDTTVCIIEVMKLMNSIRAGTRGIVAQVLVEDGATVDTDAPLVIIEPAT